MDSDILKTIAAKIKYLRGDATQREFARMLGASPQAVSDWENAIKMPRIGVIEKLSQIYGVPKSYILSGDPEPPPPERNYNLRAVPIIDSIERNSEAFEQLTDEEILEIARQMEFTIQYVKNKRKS